MLETASLSLKLYLVIEKQTGKESINHTRERKRTLTTMPQSPCRNILGVSLHTLPELQMHANPASVREGKT